MITVSISINREPVFTRTAVNRTEEYYKKRKVAQRKSGAYLLDTGEWVLHKKDRGAVELAIKILKTIKEQK